MIKILMGIFILMMTHNTLAGFETGHVAYISSASDGRTYFKLDGVKEWSPACSSNGIWAITDENSEEGKKQYAMVLAAATTGKRLHVIGKTTCNRWPNYEDVDLIQMYVN